MPRSSLLFVLGVASAALALTACGGDDDGDDGGSSADSGPGADSGSGGMPDASACSLTMCGTECVDTTSSTDHCGGCGMACDSPGQVCSGALPCACPEGFIPSAPGFTSAAIDDQLIAGLHTGVGVFSQAGITSVLLVGYIDGLAVGTPFDLSDITPPDPPLIAAQYDVDPDTMVAHAPFRATAGSVTFTELCATGVSGMLTGAIFLELAELTDVGPVAGGCDVQVASLTFQLGSCP